MFSTKFSMELNIRFNKFNIHMGIGKPLIGDDNLRTLLNKFVFLVPWEVIDCGVDSSIWCSADEIIWDSVNDSIYRSIVTWI